jgi:hypothetical protein
MRAPRDGLLLQSCGCCQSCFVELLFREEHLLLRLLGAHSILYRRKGDRCAAVEGCVLLLARRRKEEGPKEDKRFRNMIGRDKGAKGLVGRESGGGKKS